MSPLRRRSWWCFTASWLVATSAAAEPRPLSLRDAVSLAVRQSPTLAAAGARRVAADAEVLAAQGLDDPVLEASAAIERTRRERVPGTPVQERAVDRVQSSMSLTQPLPIGGRAAVRLSGGYGRTEFSTEPSPDVLQQSTAEQYSPSLQLSLEQPLLRGFGVDVARADRQRARAGRDLASAEREGLAAALVRDVVVGYWALAHARQQLEIRKLSVAAARDQLERVRANIAVGKQPPSASAEIEVAIALREDAVLLALQDASDAEVTLARLCGEAPGTRVGAAESLPALDPLAQAAPDAGATLARALEQSPQLAALRAQQRAATLELRVTENGLLPQLDLTLAGGPAANAPSARAAYDQLTGLRSYALMALVALELPVGRRAARGARDAARAGVELAVLGEADVRAQIAAAVAQGIAALETARRRALLLTSSLRSAELDLEAERARFDVGRASNFDVLRRQDALAVMRLLSLSAALAWQQASAGLDALTGENLRQHGVTLERGVE